MGVRDYQRRLDRLLTHQDHNTRPPFFGVKICTPDALDEFLENSAALAARGSGLDGEGAPCGMILIVDEAPGPHSPGEAHYRRRRQQVV